MFDWVLNTSFKCLVITGFRELANTEMNENVAITDRKSVRTYVKIL